MTAHGAGGRERWAAAFAQAQAKGQVRDVDFTTISGLELDPVYGPEDEDARVLRDALRSAELFFDELVTEAILVYTSSLRPVVPTRGSVWPPPHRRRQP